QFRKLLNFGQTKDAADKAYRAALLDALDELETAGVVSTDNVAAVSLFTTQSVTALLEKIRDQPDAATPAPADFQLGWNGERPVFPLAAVASVSFNRQTTTAPTFASSSVPIGVLKTVSASAATIAFGKCTSPDYETPARVIPPVGTATGTPAVQGMNDVYFNLVLPAGPEPPDGWPVAIAGHGGGPSPEDDARARLAAAARAARGAAALD